MPGPVHGQLNPRYLGTDLRGLRGARSTAEIPYQEGDMAMLEKRPTELWPDSTLCGAQMDSLKIMAQSVELIEKVFLLSAYSEDPART